MQLFCAIITLSSVHAIKIRGDKIKVAVISDSTAMGFGIAAEMKHTWPILLGEKLNSYEPKYEVTNYSVLATNSGTYIEEPKYFEALASKSDVYIINIGLNELKRVNASAKFVAGCKDAFYKIYNSFKNLPNKPEVYVLSSISWSDNFDLSKIPPDY